MAKKKQQDAPAAGAPAWMASFSDLMSLLLTFFVLLFAMSETDIDETALAALLSAFGNPHFATQIAVVQPNATPGLDSMFGAGMTQVPPIPAALLGDGQGQGTTQGMDVDVQMAMQSMISDFVTYFTESQNPLAEYVEITVLDDAVMLSFTDNMLFATGSSMLNPLTIGILDYVASVLLEYPMFIIHVDGHTDNVPIATVRYPNNRWLGFGRAMAVTDHFVYGHGLYRQRIRTESFGEDNPIATNETPEGRALNRRVEITISID